MLVRVVRRLEHSISVVCAGDVRVAALLPYCSKVSCVGAKRTGPGDKARALGVDRKLHKTTRASAVGRIIIIIMLVDSITLFELT